MTRVVEGGLTLSKRAGLRRRARRATGADRIGGRHRPGRDLVPDHQRRRARPQPAPLAVASEQLAAAQRDLTRKKRGSSRRKKTVTKVARLHCKVRRQRLDHAHNTALALVRDHDLIVHEDLKVKNMTARPKPRPDGNGGYAPNGAAAKAALNKSISDAGWGIFLRVLSAKAESAGRTVIAVNPRHTSQRCAECGHVAAGNRVTQAVFRCLACGHQAHADVNAARNILRAGLALQEAQAT